MVNAITSDESASYVVWVAGGVYYAQDGATGAVTSSVTAQSLFTNSGYYKVKSGQFICTGNINLAENTTIEGDSAGTVFNFTSAGQFLVNNQNIILKDFKMVGKTGIFITDSHVKILNINAAVDKTYAGAFYCYANTATISDILFRDCVADSCGTMGFFNSGEGSPSIISDIVYDNCKALNSGIASDRFSEWIMGFDLADHNDLYNCRVVNCYAYNSYESGFHFENTCIKRNVVMINCVSEYNGWNKITPSYGTGFMAANGVSLTQCKSYNNSLSGFNVQNLGASGPLFMNSCSDSYSTISIRGENNADNIYINDFLSYEANEYGIYLMVAEHFYIHNLNIVDPQGIGNIDGIRNYLGNVGSILQNSEINMNVIGSGTFLVYMNSANNVRLSGVINCTSGNNPLAIVAGTNNLVSNMKIYAKGGYGINTWAAADCDVENTHIEDIQSVKSLAVGIEGGNTVNIKSGVSVTGNTGVDYSNCLFEYNSGTATLLNGQNHVHVTHGLSYTPTAADITITFTEQPTNATTYWYVGSITNLEFQLLANDPGGSNLDFSWSARKTP